MDFSTLEEEEKASTTASKHYLDLIYPASSVSCELFNVQLCCSSICSIYATFLQPHLPASTSVKALNAVPPRVSILVKIFSINLFTSLPYRASCQLLSEA